MENVITSNLVANQLPDFIKSDYPQFVLFIEKYYEWLETTGKVSYEIEQLRNASDIDFANDFYLDMLRKELSPYFPDEILNNKRMFLKLVTQFYKSSGTQGAIKFLFRALYNENIDIYYPKEDVLKTSDGKWVLPLALRVDTNDNNIFNIEGTLLTGTTSKATAIVEKVIQSVDRQLGVSYIELFISNITKLFATGETVTSTYYDEATVSNITVNARLIGSLSEIKIQSNNRGLYYTGSDSAFGYNEGDPVSIVGGLNPLSANPIGAIAYVGSTTKGGVTDVYVAKGGFGFRDPAVNVNSSIIDFKGGFTDAPFGTEAKASINLIDSSNSRFINLSTITVTDLDDIYPNIAKLADIVGTVVSENSADPASNTINEITVYNNIQVYPISFVVIEGSGGGYRGRPDVETYSFYNEDLEDSLIIDGCIAVKGSKLVTDMSQDLTLSLEPGDYVRLFINNKYEEVKQVEYVTTNQLYFTDAFPNDITGIKVFKINRNDLYKLGSIGTIKISSGGSGYQDGDILIFNGGSGYGANGYVNVSGGVITSATINAHSSGAYVIGGEGYRRDSLPTITVQSASGVGANLSVNEIVGDGEEYLLSTSRIGAITSIKVVSYGYDYISTPIVSLRNADLTVANVTVGQLFVSNTVIYQGASNTNFTFRATVDKYIPSTGLLRIFNYIGTLDKSLSIKYDSNEALEAVTANVVSSIFYGDGNAKATAKFENGLIRYPGIYLNTDGQVSADKKLQDGDKYHNFSYVIKSKTDYDKFKKPLNDIVHPVGTKTFVVRIDDNEENVSFTNTSTFISINDLSDTFNIAYNGNTIISTNVSANLTAQVNVGDIIILSNVHKRLQNTVNVVNGSNVLFGAANSVDFIVDLQEGDTIYLSTGNTTTINQITNATHALLSTKINVTSTSATVNVVVSEIATANSVNANTIITKTRFSANGNNLNATIQKAR